MIEAKSMETAIRISIKEELVRSISIVLSARVTEGAMVKAVILIRMNLISFRSKVKKVIQRNNIWSYPLKSRI